MELSTNKCVINLYNIYYNNNILQYYHIRNNYSM